MGNRLKALSWRGRRRRMKETSTRKKKKRRRSETLKSPTPTRCPARSPRSLLHPEPPPGLLQELPGESERHFNPFANLKASVPPPSPAKHIRALLARRRGAVKPNAAAAAAAGGAGVGYSRGGRSGARVGQVLRLLEAALRHVRARGGGGAGPFRVYLRREAEEEGGVAGGGGGH
uniref:Uncharacterized protein n=1 Tax=Ananas comosus var. bracteatus TaxID=296719 RepID=A0A6V7PE38_ANACO|nr:unnamed protein product [Ananas comosus var. bracteatus]